MMAVEIAKESSQIQYCVTKVEVVPNAGAQCGQQQTRDDQNGTEHEESSAQHFAGLQKMVVQLCGELQKMVALTSRQALLERQLTQDALEQVHPLHYHLELGSLDLALELLTGSLHLKCEKSRCLQLGEKIELIELCPDLTSSCPNLIDMSRNYLL
mmetsp:Transcript_6761/g.12793  ORF Transcript_6761/g.12793 Transcript_6761/m.12793 type:complete len:156 (-) Transcript_6761:405-872(-)